MKRKALGKGLDALLPDDSTLSSYLQIDVDLIRPNPLQPRSVFKPEKLDELATSLKERGVLQPIVIRRVDNGYELVAGERRWRAAQKAGLHRIPAIVQDVSDSDMLELALIENVQRDDLSPIEEAKAYKIMASQFDLTQEEIAGRVGRSRVAVANLLRLLNLPISIQEMVVDERLTMGHARALLSLPERHQLALAEVIVRDGLSVRDTERRVKKILSSADKPPKKPTIDPNLKAAEQRLEERWKTKVEIRQRGNNGQIVFHFNSQDELERLFEDFLLN